MKDNIAHTTTITINTASNIKLAPTIVIPNEELPSELKLAYVLQTIINKIPTLARIPTTSKTNFTYGYLIFLFNMQKLLFRLSF